MQIIPVKFTASVSSNNKMDQTEIDFSHLVHIFGLHTTAYDCGFIIALVFCKILNLAIDYKPFYIYDILRLRDGRAPTGKGILKNGFL